MLPMIETAAYGSLHDTPGSGERRSGLATEAAGHFRTHGPVERGNGGQRGAA